MKFSAIFAVIASTQAVHLTSAQKTEITSKAEEMNSAMADIQSQMEEILSSINGVRRILTDFQPDFSTPFDIFQYVPQGYIRYYPLNSTLPLRDVGLKVMWEDNNGNVNPYMLAVGDVATIKLEFRPKNYIQNYLE